MTASDAASEGPVRAPREAEALAAALDRQAADLLARLAEAVRATGAEAAAEVLERLAAERRARSRRLAGGAEGARDGAPTVFEAEGLDATALATPFLALSLAVRNAERAFVFWTHVGAASPSPSVQAAAERFARAELDETARLRRERRLAWRAARGPAEPGAPTPGAREAVRRLAERLADTAARLGALGDPAAGRLAETAEEQAALAAHLPDGGAAGAGPARTLASEPGAEADAAALRAYALRLVEEAVERAFATAEAAAGETALQAALDVAHAGARRLQQIRGRA